MQMNKITCLIIHLGISIGWNECVKWLADIIVIADIIISIFKKRKLSPKLVK